MAENNMTAVEILVENLKMILPISQLNDVLVQDVIKQANEIMEQQISKAYKDGQRNGYNYYDGFDPLINVKDYYNQTYGKE